MSSTLGQFIGNKNQNMEPEVQSNRELFFFVPYLQKVHGKLLFSISREAEASHFWEVVTRDRDHKENLRATGAYQKL